MVAALLINWTSLFFIKHFLCLGGSQDLWWRHSRLWQVHPPEDQRDSHHLQVQERIFLCRCVDYIALMYRVEIQLFFVKECVGYYLRDMSFFGDFYEILLGSLSTHFIVCMSLPTERTFIFISKSKVIVFPI